MAIAVVAGVMGFSRWQRESGMRPLYTGLAPEDASAIVQKLHEGGVDYKITNNGTELLAPEDKVPELRLEMAGLGLPKTGRIGFEIFDKTNFGITDFAEHVNYRRALEGELERSIMAISEVQQARVHVTLPKDSVFTDAREPAKASVLVGLRPGTRLSSPNVIAITNLVSSAVEGLSPESVSVVDMNGNLLSRPRRDGSAGRHANHRSSARIPASGGTRPGGEDQQHAGTAAGRRQISHRRVGRHRHDQRRAKRRDVRPFQVRDGEFAEDGRHQRHYARPAPARRERQRICRRNKRLATPTRASSHSAAGHAACAAGASRTDAQAQHGAPAPARGGNYQLPPPGARKASPINPAASPNI